MNKQLLSFLKKYFTVPSSKGFSPYRTGHNIHLLFSALVAGSVVTSIDVLFHIQLSMLIKALISALSVFLFWGVGRMIGINSHYNGFLTIIIIIAVPVSIWIFPAILGGMIYGALSHLAIKVILPKTE
jgi:hypothetical protein